MSYFKKSHSHKPKTGKGSYDRKDEMDHVEEELRLDEEDVDWEMLEEMYPEFFEEDE